MKKIILIIIAIVSLLAINNLVRSIYDLWMKKDVVIEAEKTLEKEKKENEMLQKQLIEVKKPEFIEKEARNKLFMIKPGEQMVIVTSPTRDPVQDEARNKTKKLPIWQQWIKLFF